MQSTQKPPVTPAPDPTPSPAAVLRHAAIYLWRYGWTTDAFYDRAPGDRSASRSQPACVAGAIRCAVFGHPVDSLYDEIVDVDHDRHAVLITAAQKILAIEVDPEWPADSACPDHDACALEVISDWNDVDGRTIAQVLIALYSAADDWDRLHPATRFGGRRMSAAHCQAPP